MLFEGKEHYEIPAFQRPYVWNEEDQWAPLWDDIRRVAERRTGFTDEPAVAASGHFLGAVVYETKAPVAGGVTRHDVIDGQQRMTTLQLLIHAVMRILSKAGYDVQAEALEDLVVNRNRAFQGTRERFKLWPSQADRVAYESVMNPGSIRGADATHSIAIAHRFFSHEAGTWLKGVESDDEAPVGTEEERVEALSATLQDGLQLVAIDLAGEDNPQLIFETLNDRGTPLLKADLVKNWLFRRGEELGCDVQQWAVSHWADFDTEWWREEVSQGRQRRSRIDIFIQYWLTMKRLDEVKTDDVFRSFEQYASARAEDADSATLLLTELRDDADNYRSFAELDTLTPEGRFHSRVIETIGLAATMPIFMWLRCSSDWAARRQTWRATSCTGSCLSRLLMRVSGRPIPIWCKTCHSSASTGPCSKAASD